MKKSLVTEIKLKECAQKESAKYKLMSRTYWERWRWELEKRKEIMVKEMQSRSLMKRHSSPQTKRTNEIQHINPDLLLDPVVNGKQEEVFIGRGSFGVVRMQLYRGIKVAVKEFLPRTIANDVLHEACIMAHLCHPNLPMLFGVCLQSQPYHKIIMQCHFLDNANAVTLEQELKNKNFKDSYMWLMLCSQLFEVVSYLHMDIHILHNDIKVDNILIANSLTLSTGYQIVLIDFGKATLFKDAKHYSLSFCEKQQYFRLYPHLAPEVIEGETKQSIQSDMFSLGLVIHKIVDAGCFSGIAQLSIVQVKQLANACRNVKYLQRPKSHEGLALLRTVMS